jgi:WD40 repeat protein
MGLYDCRQGSKFAEIDTENDGVRFALTSIRTLSQ